MALTSFTKDGRNLVLMTIPDKNYIFIELYAADENFKPYGDPERSIEHLKSEETIHREIRKAAALSNVYVKEHSTNAEWNPELTNEKPKSNEQT